ncbi:hypothetical protein M422DRAFT_776791 [Sphaerobolus stellatus SS14]|nr:hypothetical protein M422DRAFT_776791 [Sphaerobolus stellatus SS14]
MAGLGEDPLEAALASAFAESPIIAKENPPVAATTTPEPAAEEVPAESTEAEEENGADDSWKEELEQLEASWRAESARAREKAEQERERWRLIREQEEAERKAKGLAKSTQSEFGWESVATSSKIEEEPTQKTGEAARRSSPSPVDARDLVSGEHQRLTESELRSLLPHSDTHPAGNTPHTQDISFASVPPSNPDDNGSRTWEDLPSVESSFPSFSMTGSEHHEQRPSYPEPAPHPPSVTLAIFDSSLTRRARIFALVSSVTINLFLPFVNGVMLGFGEIFARNVVGYFGWQLPGAGVGIRTRTKAR